MENQSRKNGLQTMVCIVLILTTWLIDSGSHKAEALSDITPTSTPGLDLGTKVSPDRTVITGGTLAGTNLFHSFNTFSVETKAIAVFQNTVGVDINNIFARVIGPPSPTGEAQLPAPSQIDGTIQTNGFGNANLWFMNPSGIVFGPNAKLDIGGSATFTTANFIQFVDQGIFGIGSHDVSDHLSVASVTSFGFFPTTSLTQPSPIAITGSNLSVSPGQTLSFVGGNMTISGGQLQAPDGAMRITSVDHVDANGAFVNVDQKLSSPTRPIILGQSPFGKDAVIDTGSTGTIQINGVTYSGTNPTGLIPTDIGDGVLVTPAIKIQDGSIVIGNLPRIPSTLVANQPPTKLIVSSPAVTSLSPNTSVDVGGSGNLIVTLNHAFTSPVNVQLGTDNSKVASVTPASVLVAAGQDSAPAQVQGLAAGVTFVRASTGNTSAGASVRVGLPPDGSSSNGTLPPNNGGSPKILTDPTTVLTAASPPPNQLIMASDRCTGSATGEFSSFVQSGREAPRPQPGGLLSSPPYLEDEIPHISERSVQPTLRAVGPLNLAPSAIAFLHRGYGCRS